MGTFSGVLSGYDRTDLLQRIKHERQSGIPPLMYHWTVASNLSSIKKHGLRAPVYMTRSGDINHWNPYIFEPPKDEMPLRLVIDTTKLDQAKFTGDTGLFLFEEDLVFDLEDAGLSPDHPEVASWAGTLALADNLKYEGIVPYSAVTEAKTFKRPAFM
jgi:hypothetical protein